MRLSKLFPKLWKRPKFKSPAGAQKTPQATKNITQFLRRIKRVIDVNSFLVFFSR
jgi:hypothetical protein